jgi:hypothetical protein
MSPSTSKVEIDPTLLDFFEEAWYLGALEDRGGAIVGGLSVEAIVDRLLDNLVDIHFGWEPFYYKQKHLPSFSFSPSEEHMH